MNNKKLSIVIADDQKMFAQSLAFFLKDDCFSIEAILTNYDSLLIDIKKYTIDLLLLDVSFGSGKNSIDVLQKLKQENDIKIIMLTSHDKEFVEHEALKKGADGFIHKYNDLEQLKSLLLQYFEALSKPNIPHTSIHITEREKEIVTLLYLGSSEKEIATQLFISITTVKTHKKNLFQKLNVQKQSELIKRCIDDGILIV
ncbi:response regulator [Aquimarina longa]|uniref:response regulator transcription factor n=1 Tax=Aquimarina longa TaxID=1080221 RepID=UPI0007842189|nr:response regulator transcription factor [Aquimarina longa]